MLDRCTMEGLAHSLRVLDLSCNSLASLHDVLGSLRPLVRLEHLSLMGNPLSTLASYEGVVFENLPALQTLDGKATTPGNISGVANNSSDNENGSLGTNFIGAGCVVTSAETLLREPKVRETEGSTVSPVVVGCQPSSVDDKQLEVVNHWLRVRLNAMEEIVAMQEAELAQGSDEDPGEARPNSQERLLNLWRSKVFELLLERERITLALEGKVIEARTAADAEIVRSSRLEKDLKLLAKKNEALDANLQIETVHRRQAEARYQEAREQLANLQEESENQLKAHAAEAAAANKAIHQVSDTCLAMKCTVSQKLEALAESQEKLQGFDHRLRFANERLQVVERWHQASKQTLQHKLERVLVQGVPPDGDTIPETVLIQHADHFANASRRGPERTDFVVTQLAKEVERLTKERAMLLGQLQDANRHGGKQEWETIQLELKGMSEEAALHEAKLKELELEMARKDEVIRQQEREAEAAKEASSHLATKFESLERSFASELSTAQRQLEASEASREDALQHKQQADIELESLRTKLDSLKREHSRTVVQLRQTDRELSKQRDEEKNTFSLQIEELEGKLAKKDDQLKSLTRERHALLATVSRLERSCGALDSLVGADDLDSRETRHSSLPEGCSQRDTKGQESEAQEMESTGTAAAWRRQAEWRLQQHHQNPIQRSQLAQTMRSAAGWPRTGRSKDLR
eukprot:scaffold1659_cov371-Prasinococcus_capsulatus_cf.AAC.20